MKLYKNKAEAYFSNVRLDLISLFPATKIEKLLEVGAGSGDTLVEIKKRGLASEVVGIELMELAGSNQTNPLIDKFLFGDFETMDAKLTISYFDVILCGDVLEHLVDPWAAVTKLSQFLKSGGTLIISCPNVRHYSMFTEVFIRGRFRYSDHGLFDKTHLRFFCKNDLIKLASVENR